MLAGNEVDEMTEGEAIIVFGLHIAFGACVVILMAGIAMSWAV